jgi:hypothetical protein
LKTIEIDGLPNLKMGESFHGKLLNNQIVSAVPTRLPSGKRLQKTMERSTMLLMGKLTTSTGPFSIAMLVYQRVVFIVDVSIVWIVKRGVRIQLLQQT